MVVNYIRGEAWKGGALYCPVWSGIVRQGKEKINTIYYKEVTKK